MFLGPSVNWAGWGQAGAAPAATVRRGKQGRGRAHKRGRALWWLIAVVELMRWTS
jgi:hypothetical protein